MEDQVTGAFLPNGEVEEQVVEEIVEEPVEEEEETEEEIVTDQPTVEDPGVFTPTDHSFDVDVFDDEGKKLKTVKISTVDEWDKLLDDEPNLGSSSALLKAQRLATKMETALEREKTEYDKKKAEYDEAQEADKARTEQLNTWSNEIEYLVERGDLPKVAKEYVDADWSDDEVKKQPGVKEQLELLAYINKENKARAKAGIKPINSMVDGFNAWQRDSMVKKPKVDPGRLRQQAGAKVSGASVTGKPTSGMPEGLMIGRINI